MKKWLRIALKWVVTMAVTIGASVLGVFCRDLVPNAVLWHWIAFAVLLAAIVVCPLLSSVRAKKLKDSRVTDMVALRDRRLDRMAADAQRELRRLRLATAVTVAYLVFITITALAVCFFCGASGVGIGSTTTVAMFFLYGMVARFLRERQKKPDFSQAMPREEFPMLYRMAEEAAGPLSKNNRIHLFVSDNIPDEEGNVGIAHVGKDIWLILGTMVLGTLEAEELKQVLEHEFAHLEHDDNGHLVRFDRLMRFMDGGDDDGFLANLAAIAFRLPYIFLAYEGSFYFFLSSRQKEMAADDEVCDQERMCSALAKIAAHNLFHYETQAYDCIFRSEEIPTDFATARVNNYRRKLTERKGEWRQILESGISSKVDTHPTFRQRWESLGACAYTLTPAALDDAYGAECWAAIATCDKERASVEKEKYDEMRRRAYLEPLERIQAYEAEGKLLPPEEMRPIMDAYFTVGQPDQMEALCDEIIRTNDSPTATAFSRYWKGFLLLHRYDAEGIGYIYQAIETNRNYTQAGMDEIGKFCTLMGLQEELEEYRRRAVEYFQIQKDWDHSEGITARADLSAETLPEGWLEQIIGHILASAGEAVTEIYLVHEVNKSGCAMSSFILRFADGTEDEVVDKVYDSTFRLLDDWPTDWEFCLYVYEPDMAKALKKLPEALVYAAEPKE